MKGESKGSGRVLLNLRTGRAEVRDDLLIDYILRRLPPVLADAVRQRAAIDPMVRRRIEDLRRQLLDLASGLSDVPDESLPPEWRELLRRIDANRK